MRLSEARNGRITASLVGEILGLSPYGDRKSAMKKFFGNASIDPEAPPLVYGHRMEPVAKGSLGMALLKTIQEADFYIHPDHDWIGATPDGFVTLDGVCHVVEIKCPYGMRNDENPTFKPIAELPHYHAQVQIQMFCTGEKRCVFYQFSPYGSKTEFVDFDQSWIDENLPKLREFYDECRSEQSSTELEWLKVSHQVEELEKKLKSAKKTMDELTKKMLVRTGEAGGQYGRLYVKRISRKGSISYKAACDKYLTDTDLEQFRGEDVVYYKVSEA